MSEDVQTTTPVEEAGAPIPFAPPKRRWRRPPPGPNGRPPKPKVRKLRLLLILLGLAVLAFISTVFGMMMAVASDLPQLENQRQYKLAEQPSFLTDVTGKPIGVLAPPNKQILVTNEQISKAMKNAIIAIEDKRFRTNQGVDIRGIARAFVADITGGARQGASTIAQQFVKVALAQQNNRTVFEKLREAALAYHLTRKWSKDKILTEYLNRVYFGNGAYGIESAARVYFGAAHGFDVSAQTNQNTGACNGSPCALQLTPAESALLAGMVANPTAYDPFAHPYAARARRDVVLRNMMQQGYIMRDQYVQASAQLLPTTPERPQEPTVAPYFTSWVRPQIIHALGDDPFKAYYGGLKIRTSLDLDMQHAAEQAISNVLPQDGTLPTASLVAIDNHTGEVRAMVGGPILNGQEDFKHQPFNIATEGHRQPGSSFKPFTLAVALRSGISPDSTWTSAPADFIVPNSGRKEHFSVHNFANSYSGSNTLAGATTVSDNSIYSRVGIVGLGPTGTKRIAALATNMGIRSPLSTNYAMILGGLREGVTPLDMAHAYETFAMHGQKVVNPRFSQTGGPIGIDQIQGPGGNTVVKNVPQLDRVLPASVAQTVHDILTTVVQSGTATQAAISGVDVAGKTGTTSNYGDAWFVAWTPQMTTAVWVGFPNKTVSMSTLYNGQPVEGGTYPAIIWHDFMTQALQILANEQAAKQSGQTTTTTTTDTGSGASGSGASSGGGTSSNPASTTAAPSNGTTAAGGTGATGGGAGGGTGAGTGAGAGAGGGGTGAGGGPPAGGGTTGGGGGTGSGGAGSGGAGLGKP
jgi:penicillin-binding protein 1A